MTAIFPLALGADFERLHPQLQRRFGVSLEVRNRVLGFLFGYEGSFTCEYPQASDAPSRLKPVRHETRL